MYGFSAKSNSTPLNILGLLMRSESSVNTHSGSSESRNYKNLSLKNFISDMSFGYHEYCKKCSKANAKCKYPYLDLSYVTSLILLNSLSYMMMS